MAVAWLVASALSMLSGEEDGLSWISTAPSSSNSGGAAASGGGDSNARPKLPANHPPVPFSARSLCAAGLEAAVSHTQSWIEWTKSSLESQTAFIVICIIASVFAGVRRYYIEKHIHRGRPPIDPRLNGAFINEERGTEREWGAMDEWLAQNTRRPSVPQPSPRFAGAGNRDGDS